MFKQNKLFIIFLLFILINLSTLVSASLLDDFNSSCIELNGVVYIIDVNTNENISLLHDCLEINGSTILASYNCVQGELSVSFEPSTNCSSDNNSNQSCSSASDCPSGYCDPHKNACSDGGIGSGCWGSSDCATGYCDSNNTCSDGGIGSGCYDASGCATGYCDTINNICTDGSIGSGCRSSSECLDSACDLINNICSNNVTGSPCHDNSDCESGICAPDCEPYHCADIYSGNLKRVCSDGSVGSSCDSLSGCAEGYYCDPFNVCSNGALGAPCHDDSNCNSGFCDMGFCAEPSINVLNTINSDFTTVIGSNANADDNIASIDISGKFGLGTPREESFTSLNQDLIVVGGPCVNTISAQLMGNPTDCTAGFEPGKGMIKVFGYNGKTQIMVAGMDALDTRIAAKALINYQNYNLTTNPVITYGSSLDDVNVE